MLIEHNTNTTVTKNSFGGDGTTRTVKLYELGIPMTNILAYYPFNGDYLDYSGNQQHLSTIGSPVLSDGIRDRQCYNFPTSSDALETTTMGGVSNNLTVSFFLKMDSSIPANFILFHGQTTVSLGFSYAFYYTSNNFYFTMNGVAYTQWTHAGSFVVDTWYHFAFTYNSALGSDNMKMWVNGVVVAVDDYGEPISNEDGLTIGRDGIHTGAWGCPGGNFQDFRVYDATLTEAQINTLFKMFDPTKKHAIQFNNDGSLNVFGEVKEKL